MKIVLDVELTGELKNNDIIVYKNGKWKAISRESFLGDHDFAQRQEFAKHSKHLDKLDIGLSQSNQFQKIVNDLHAKLLAKSLYDNLINNGELEMDEDFEQAYLSWLNGKKEDFIENAPNVYKNILDKIIGEK